MKIKRVLYALLVLCTVVIVACDDRGEDTPTMEVTAADTFVYNELNFNELDFEVHLDGPSSKISERKILVDFDDAYGDFFGDASSEYIRTNSNGVATGKFAAKDTIGVVKFKFTLETWPSETEEISIKIVDLPRIDSVVATVDTLVAGGGTSTQLKAYISSLNADLWGYEILWEADYGSLNVDENYTTLQHNSSETDEDGIAYNNFISTDVASVTRIFARLQLNQSRYKSTIIRCVDRN
jgi:hypothetical protein